MTLAFAALAASDARADTPARGPDPGAADASPAEPAAASAGLQTKALGRVLGQVQAGLGGQLIALPGAVVALKDTAGRDAGESGRSDAEGHFEIPSHPPGTYRLCASAPGFTPKCAVKPLVIAADTQYLAENLALRPAGSALRGRVLLADGSPCHQFTAVFGTLVAAEVSLTGRQGSVKAAGNDRGKFVLAGLAGPGTYTLSARCQGAEAIQSVTLTRAHLNGEKAMDVTVANSPPVIRALFAQDASGRPLRAFSPGQTVEVVAEVADPDPGDMLSFKWADGTESFQSVDARTISWTLPNVEARSFLNLEVSDGKGGFAVHQLTVGTSDTGARFLGTLRDPRGKPMPNATATVDDQPASIDAEGNFRAAVRGGDRHVLTVKQPGHAPISRIFHGPAMGLQLTLKPATRRKIDPARPILISEQGVDLSLGPNQLVDESGNRPTGPLNVDIYRYDIGQGELPGDPAGLRMDQSETAFVGMDAVSIEITDDHGTRYDIAPGGSGTLSFPTPPTASRDMRSGSSSVLASYDHAKGTWAARSSATLRGARSDQASIARLGTWSLAVPSGDKACLQVSVDPFTLERPFNLRLHVPGAGPTLRDFTITEPITLVPFLPASVDVQLDVTPVDAPQRPLFSTSAKTGANLSSPIPPFPYTACGGHVTLAARLPAKDWLNRFTGDQESAALYYLTIGARPLKDTFAKWLTANGFASPHAEGEVVFFNPNELGLGRKANCRRKPSHQACYVTKYGHVGGSPVEAFDDTIHNFNPGDTVALEADRVDPGKPPVVKYYVFRPDGKLSTNTLFDTSGPKFVPGVCQHCHGTGPGKFVVLDPQAYQYPGVPKDSPHGLDKQQEKFRLINEAVAFSHVHAGPYYDFLSSLYPNGAPVGVHKPGSKAIPAPVPVAWQKKAFVYENAVKPSCRTCHMWQDPLFAFDDPGDNFFPQTPLGSGMPNAMGPMLRLWKTTDPSLVQVFNDGVFPSGKRPVLTVVPFFGPVIAGKVISHQATTSDPQDGPDCCSVRWSSDMDGHLGTGKNIQFAYPSPGERIITVYATDKDGHVDAKSFRRQVDSAPPQITVVAPTGPVSAGGIGGVVHKVTVSDREDGPDCCTAVWDSDKDGRLGVGREVEFAYPSTGARTITVTATDSDAVTNKKTFQVTVKNDPPFVRIDVPAVGAAVFKNTPVVVQQTNSDPNEPFGVPCARLTWASSKAVDTSFPFTGCEKAVSFATLGQRTISLTATDKDGLTATATRLVDVKAVPPQAPPVVSIVDPHDGDVLDPGTAIALNGAVNPGAGAATFRWTVFVGGNEVDIGSAQTLSWDPGANVPFHCGGSSVVLKHYATNANGTGTASINVRVFYPVC
jgi:hypothetical protein